MWYLATIQKASRLFLAEGEQVAELVAKGKEGEALKFIERNTKEWKKAIQGTWTAIVEEVGTETFNSLKSAVSTYQHKDEGDAFNPWEATIQDYIRSTVGDKVVKVNAGTKKNIRKLIDDLRAEDANLDQISKAIKEKYKSFSRYRAYRIARTEVVGASNYASIKSAEQSGVVEYKEWISSNDDRVRESHEDVHGRKIKLDEKFKNGLLFPADYSANKPAETIQCRCTLAYFTKTEPEKPKVTKPTTKPKRPRIKTRAHLDIDAIPISQRGKVRLETTMKDLKTDEQHAQEVMNSLSRWSGNTYTTIREFERGEVRDLPQIEKHANNIAEFLAKSPKWGMRNGALFRGIAVPERVAKEILEQAESGAIIDMKGSASWSSRQQVAENFMSMNSGKRILFTIKGTRLGASMKHLSDIPSEDEVLVPHIARYKAKRIRKTDSYIHIELEEIDEEKKK